MGASPPYAIVPFHPSGDRTTTYYRVVYNGSYGENYGVPMVECASGAIAESMLKHLEGIWYLMETGATSAFDPEGIRQGLPNYGG